MTDGLLLLHGFPVDASMWEPQRTALGGRVPVLAANAPGFGGTPLAGPVTTVEAVADAAAGAADELGLGRLVVGGLSMGGYAALAFRRRHPGRVAGLVLANTRSQADDEEGRERRRALARRLTEEGSAFLVRSPPPLLGPDAPEELWDRIRATIAAQPAEAVAAMSLGLAERPDFTDDLAGIDVPTLVIASDRDSLIPMETTTLLAQAIPGARLTVIRGAGHLSNLERPAEFTAALLEHLLACGLVLGGPR